ncbi:hypothetical protein [Blastococcus sp. SYSU DS0619]
MTVPLSVPMGKLREALDRVLTALEAERGDEVPLSADYYWVLDARATYRVDETPSAPDFTLGQLSDDVDTLDEILEPDQVISVWHDLRHLVGILHRLATQDLPGPSSIP